MRFQKRKYCLCVYECVLKMKKEPNSIDQSNNTQFSDLTESKKRIAFNQLGIMWRIKL